MDASAFLAQLYGEAPAAPGKPINTAGALVPVIWRVEVLNSFLMALRRDRFTPLQMDRIVTEFLSLDVDTDGDPVEDRRILELGRQYRLTAYDATYLELALRRNLPLATLDAELQLAARRAGVPLIA